MSEYKVIEIKQSIFADNDRDAEILREELKEKGTFLLCLVLDRALNGEGFWKAPR